MPLSEEQKRENKINRTWDRYRSMAYVKAVNDCLKEFQLLRRLQCSNKNGDCNCISCGKIDHYKKMDAGHFISRTKRSTAFNCLNVWPQCKYCNQHLNGNLAEYRKNLINEIGINQVQILEAMSKTEVKPGLFELAQLKVIYKTMINERS